MEFSKKEIAGILAVIAILFGALTEYASTLKTQHESDQKKIAELEESNGIYNVQMAYVKLNDFLNGKDQSFENGRQIIFHLGEAAKYKADPLEIGQVAISLDHFINYRAHDNEVAKQMNEHSDFVQSVICFENVRYK